MPAKDAKPAATHFLPTARLYNRLRKRPDTKTPERLQPVRRVCDYLIAQVVTLPWAFRLPPCSI